MTRPLLLRFVVLAWALMVGGAVGLAVGHGPRVAMSLGLAAFGVPMLVFLTGYGVGKKDGTGNWPGA
jgi:hypothetical protein